MRRRNRLWPLAALLSGLVRAAPAAGAEIRASAGPVQLTLRVHKTVLRLLESVETRLDSAALAREVPNPGKLDQAAMERALKKHRRSVVVRINEPLWVQIEVKNAGSGPFIVDDALFDPRANFGDSLGSNIKKGSGTYIVITGPDGKAVNWSVEPAPIDGCAARGAREAVGSPEQQRGADAIVENGRKEGLSREGIQKRLDAYSAETGGHGRATSSRRRLEPGQLLITPGWIDSGTCGERRPPPAPVDGFAELRGFLLTKAGKYRIRAVYDERPPLSWPRSKRESYLKEAPGAVKAATPDVVVEVAP